MTTRASTAKPPALSASRILQALGDELLAIKAEDGLTFKDVGRLIGKSEDQAAKYCDASATMDVVTFAFAKREWNGRFTRHFDELVSGSRHNGASDRSCESKVLRAALALSIALDGDEEITPAEVKANRATIEQARDVLDGLLAKVVRAA